MNQMAMLSVGRVVAGVFFVWSLTVLGTVYGGLGARYSLHPDAELAALSSVDLSSATSGVGGMDEYAVISERPLFNESRRPIPTDGDAGDAAPVAVQETALNVTVTSIVITPEHRFAIVLDQNTSQSQTLKPGDALAGDQSSWRLAELGPRNAVFEGPGGRSTLELRVFDGTGGQAPTPVAAAPVIQESTASSGAGRGGADAQPVVEEDKSEAPADSPESRAEQIRRRIEERRRQMREEAERARAERGE